MPHHAPSDAAATRSEHHQGAAGPGRGKGKKPMLVHTALRMPDDIAIEKSNSNETIAGGAAAGVCVMAAFGALAEHGRGCAGHTPCSCTEAHAGAAPTSRRQAHRPGVLDMFTNIPGSRLGNSMHMPWLQCHSSSSSSSDDGHHVDDFGLRFPSSYRDGSPRDGQHSFAQQQHQSKLAEDDSAVVAAPGKHPGRACIKRGTGIGTSCTALADGVVSDVDVCSTSSSLTEIELGVRPSRRDPGYLAAPQELDVTLALAAGSASSGIINEGGNDNADVDHGRHNLDDCHDDHDHDHDDNDHHSKGPRQNAHSHASSSSSGSGSGNSVQLDVFDGLAGHAATSSCEVVATRWQLDMQHERDAADLGVLLATRAFDSKGPRFIPVTGEWVLGTSAAAMDVQCVRGIIKRASESAAASAGQRATFQVAPFLQPHSAPDDISRHLLRELGHAALSPCTMWLGDVLVTHKQVKAVSKAIARLGLLGHFEEVTFLVVANRDARKAVIDYCNCRVDVTRPPSSCYPVPATAFGDAGSGTGPNGGHKPDETAYLAFVAELGEYQWVLVSKGSTSAYAAEGHTPGGVVSSVSDMDVDAGTASSSGASSSLSCYHSACTSIASTGAQSVSQIQGDGAGSNFAVAVSDCTGSRQLSTASLGSSGWYEYTGSDNESSGTVEWFYRQVPGIKRNDANQTPLRGMHKQLHKSTSDSVLGMGDASSTGLLIRTANCRPMMCGVTYTFDHTSSCSDVCTRARDEFT